MATPTLHAVHTEPVTSVMSHVPLQCICPPQRGRWPQNRAAVEGQVGVLMIRGRGSASCHTLEVASIGEAGPDGCPLPSCPLEKWSSFPCCLLGVPLCSLNHQTSPSGAKWPNHLPHPHLWLVGFPES